MLQSIYNLMILILTGDFRGPLFGLFEDAPILQPVYLLHQTPAGLLLLILLAALLIHGMRRGK